MLKSSGRDHLDVALFEWEDRIGGRLWSIEMPGMPNVPAEMGGMRFLESMQNFYGLSKTELKLEVGPFGFKDNIQYLRRRRFDFTEYSNPEKVPYYLTKDEIGKSWMQLVMMAVEKMVPGFKGHKGKDLIEFLRSARVTQEPLYDMPLYKASFWNLLSSHLSIEAYHLIVEASGYYSIYSDCNAYIAILDFVRNYEDMEYHGIKQGTRLFPGLWQSAFTRRAGRFI